MIINEWVITECVFTCRSLDKIQSTRKKCNWLVNCVVLIVCLWSVFDGVVISLIFSSSINQFLMNVPHKLCRHLQDMSFEVQHFLQWMGFCRNNERLSELFVKIVQHQPTKTFWNENSNNLDRFYLLWTAFIEAKISNFKRIIMESVYCSQIIVWTWLLVHNKINIFTSLNAVSQDFSGFLQS